MLATLLARNALAVGALIGAFVFSTVPAAHARSMSDPLPVGGSVSTGGRILIDIPSPPTLPGLSPAEVFEEVLSDAWGVADTTGGADRYRVISLPEDEGPDSVRDVHLYNGETGLPVASGIFVDSQVYGLPAFSTEWSQAFAAAGGTQSFALSVRSGTLQGPSGEMFVTGVVTKVTNTTGRSEGGSAFTPISFWPTLDAADASAESAGQSMNSGGGAAGAGGGGDGSGGGSGSGNGSGVVRRLPL